MKVVRQKKEDENYSTLRIDQVRIYACIYILNEK